MTPKNSKFFIPVVAVLCCLGAFFALRAAFTGYPPGPDDEVHAIATQSDGRAILGGAFSGGGIQRLDTDGTIDETFITTWTAGGFNATVRALAIQRDNGILAGGDFTSFDTSVLGHIARLNADGSLDTPFANAIGTGFNDTVTSLTLQTDGKILAGGRFDSFDGVRVVRLARLNADGTLDRTFKTDDGFDGAVLAFLIDSNHSLIVGGDFRSAQGVARSFLAGLSDAGTLDPRFSE